MAILISGGVQLSGPVLLDPTGGSSPTPAGGFQGSNFGYASGDSDTIDKFPFASDANATDVGDLTVARGYVAGQSSTASGYTSGGFNALNIIDKFPFASDANASDVGDLTQGR